MQVTSNRLKIFKKISCCLSLFFVSFFICETAHAKLSETSQWLALIHYQKSVFGGYKSSIDSDNFFLSGEKGKISPEAELEATIALFNSKDDEKKCLFPARYEFLKREGLIKTAFPKCKEYEQFVKDLQPSGVTLLFTDAYMNNPSSLFGHTLFRVDTKRKGTQLLAHGVNYGAFVDPNEAGALFVVYGLTGGYFGGFTVKPYYDVINMYNNIENRDIWELSLNLTDAELNTFVAHLWEIGHTQTRYYFFTKNCSYLLMELLDAVKPDLELAKKFWFHTIPLDTFKTVGNKEGLVKGINYRPSRQSKIVYQHKQLNQKQRASYSKLIKKGEFDGEGLSESEKAGVLDTMYQYVQYLNVEGDISREDYREKSFKLLMLRNQIAAKDEFSPLEKKNTPMDSHESKRAAVGFGFRNGETFQEIMFRPAYHSLNDNNSGYLKGAEINFLNATFRHYDRQSKFVLQNFDLVGIKSITPVNEMFSPNSYEIKLSVDREFDGIREEDGYVFNTLLSGGMTYEMTDRIWLYGLIDNKIAYGGFVPENAYIGIGGRFGVYADFGGVKVLTDVGQMVATDDFGTRFKWNFEASYILSVNQSLAFKYMYLNGEGRSVSEPMISWRWHF